MGSISVSAPIGLEVGEVVEKEALFNLYTVNNAAILVLRTWRVVYRRHCIRPADGHDFT